MSLLVNCLFFISFMDLFAVSLMVPLLSAHIKAFGASHILVGFASSIYAVLQFFCGPVAGSWSDVKGRQPVLLLSLLICSICYFILGFASHILIIIFIRVVLGALKHTQSLCKAIISDVVPKEDQTKILGQYNAYSGIGFIFGPVIGGHLAELKNGFFYVCCITTMLFVINSSIAYLIVPTTERKKRKYAKREKSFGESVMMAISRLFSLNWSLYWDAFTIKLILAFSISLLFANYSLTLQERFNLTPSIVGYTISFQSILGAVSGFGAGSVRRMYRHGPAKLTQHGFIALTASFFFISVCSSLWTFLAALAPLAAVSSILRTALSQWTLERAPADEKGSVLGAQHSLSAMARMTAPTVAGIAQSFLGPKGPCLISLFVSIFGIIIASIVIKEQDFRHKGRIKYLNYD